MATMTTHLLLIDDHALFRSGISMVLSAGLGDIRITEAGSLEQALMCPDEAVDLLLLDLKLSGLNGLEGIALLKRKWPQAKIVVVTAAEDTNVRHEALERGALGFISKTEPPARMLELVSQILAGEQPPLDASAVEFETTQGVRLSPRQCEVLDLLCLGLPNKLIGKRLNLSENTVRGHVQAILQTLQVSSRSEAAFVARRLGLVS